MQKRIATLVAGLILAAAPCALAQEANYSSQYTWTTFHRVHLRNGNTLEGSLVGQSDTSVILKQPWGEILVRRDQIDRVEFVKMKSFRDPELIVAKLPKVSSKAVAEIAKMSDPAAVPPVDSEVAAMVPAYIPQDVVLAVDQAIAAWKSAVGNERQDLGTMLESLGAGVVPYLEFLVEKRPQTTPLLPVMQGEAALAEETFIECSKRLMASGTSEAREAAVTVLAKLTSPRRIPIIMIAMEDTNPSVWKPAMDALLDAAKQDVDKRDMVEWISTQVMKAKNKPPYAIALARIGGRQAQKVLWDLVYDSDETNRLTGLHGLGIMANPEDGDRMLPLLRDQSMTVRKNACLALGKMKFAPAVGDLINILSENDPGLTKNARWALSQITGLVVSDNNEAWTEWWQISGSKTDRFRR